MNIGTRARAVWAHRKRLRAFAQKVASLDIEHAGLDADGDAFVKIRDGHTFFGHPTRASYKPAYRHLPAPVRSRLPLEAFQVALDVVIRYHEGALKYGGPIKQRNHRVRPGEHVAEMGAYLGHYSMRLADQVGPEGRVLAIEANPYNHRILQKNVATNALAQVRVVQTGVWNGPGRLFFSIRPDDHQSTSVVLRRADEESVEVPVETLDSILHRSSIDSVDLMIIQLNGAEPEALEGLTTVRPLHLAIASRYAKNGASTTPKILDILEARGYATEVVDEEFIFAD